MAGKGDKPRIGNYSVYRNNFDNINWKTKCTCVQNKCTACTCKGECGCKTCKKDFKQFVNGPGKQGPSN